ncbi:MAG: hypothetical protein H7Y11_11385, partial [Armatimonadetes bacterium]|nr:hypothetical protein [Anaerolineae bacterium]
MALKDLLTIGWLYKPPKNPSLATPAYMAQMVDRWVLTQGDENYVAQVKAAGASPDSRFWLYFSADNGDDPGRQALLPPNTPYQSHPNRPLRNNVCYQEGDITRIRDLHPNWFMRRPDGSVIHKNLADHIVFDLGKPGVRQFFCERINNATWSQGWNGVFFDNLHIYFTAAHGEPVATQQYGDGKSDAWLAMMLNYLDEVRAQCVTPNKGALGGNLQGEDLARWCKVAKKLDVIMIEFFSMWRDSYKQPADWERDLRKMQFAQANNIEAWAVTPFDPTLAFEQNDATHKRRFNFGLASYLLVVGPTSVLRASHEPYTHAYNFPEFAEVRALGFPKGRYFKKNSTLYRRDFTNGYVEVNPFTQPPTAVINVTQRNIQPPQAPFVAQAEGQMHRVNDSV